MKKIHLALAAVLSLAAAAASALTNDLSAGSFAATAQKSDRSNFTDIYNFSLGGVGSAVNLVLTEIKSGDTVDIDWGDVAAVSLYGGLDATGPAVLVFGGPYAPALTLNFSQIAVPPQFSIAISGRAIGSGGDAVPPVIGEYRLEVATAPVPEPSSWALMFAGLGALGFAASRRRLARI